MTSRIPNIFNKNKSKNKKTFISYLVCGDPSRDITLSAMHTMSKSGVDIIELGIPFTDPIADGPTIQKSIDRSLKNRYRHNFQYDTVYVDLDDTIIVKNNINIQMISFLFQCINKEIRIVLITKSLENDLNSFLSKNRIISIFDNIIHIKENDRKSNFIKKNSNAIFIDDSYSQRLDVNNICQIPTFDPSMVEILLDDKLY